MPRQAITKIRSKDSNNVEETFNIGALFENIYYSDSNEYSLKDFFDYMQNLLEKKPLLIQFSTGEPVAQSVQIWYKVENNPDFDN